jgi:hypothetical protein
MIDIFAVETPARTAGLAVRAETGFRFYAADQAFAHLEGRSFVHLKEIHAEIRLAEAPRTPSPSRYRGKRRRREVTHVVA